MSKKRRFVHSFWCAPAMLNENNDRMKAVYDMWVFAMSALHIKRNGYEIVLHTDALGEEIFGAIPYDAIYRTLDIGIDPAFWTASKMTAHGAEPIGSIHIDGDVFIKKPEILAKIAEGDYDLCIERKTELHCNERIMEKMLPYIEHTLPEWMSKTTNVAYNTGVVALNNAKHKKLFLDKAWEWGKLLTAAKDYKKNPTQSDLIIEMGWLRQSAEHMGLKVLELFQHDCDITRWQTTDARIWSDVEGYEHNYKHTKYLLLPHIKQHIRETERPLYDKLMAVFKPKLY